MKLLALFIFSSFISFSQEVVTVDETVSNPDNQMPVKTTVEKSFTIEGEFIVLKYDLNQPVNQRVGCSGTSKSIVLKLPYHNVDSSYYLDIDDVEVSYYMMGGMFEQSSISAHYLHMEMKQIDSILFVKGEVDFVVEADQHGNNSQLWQAEFRLPTEKQVKSVNYDMGVKKLISSADDEIYDICDQDANFPGGMRALQQFLTNNLRYPEEAIDMGMQGKVYISFVVERDGTLSTVKILRGVSQSLDKEAKRLVRSMPKWDPGIVNGKIIRCRVRLPIAFIMR